MMNDYIRYFKNPLQGISAYTSYRTPNSLVHFPVILMISYLGIFVCRAEAKPMLPLYFIIALYLSRDLVILSYSNYYVPIAIWIIFILFFIFKTEVSQFLTFNSLQRSVYATAAISVGFLIYITLFIQAFFKK